MSLSARLGNLGVHTLGHAALRWARWQDERRIHAHRPSDEVPLLGPLHHTARMKELMSRHYLEGRYVEGRRPVAWVTSGAPVEVLQALGFYFIYPENHAALCGARRKAQELCEVAEASGYSRDLCSYARTDIGAVQAGSPLAKLPKPDLLLCCNNICQTVLYWYRVLAEEFQVPLYVIDTPFLYEAAQDHQVDFVKRQLEGLIEVGEPIANKSLDWNRLKQVVARSKEASDLWLEIMDRAQHRPSPISAFDGFINMGPIVDLRGEAVTVEFYRSLLAEIDQRVAEGKGAVIQEQKRVLWDNLPIWYRMGRLSKTLARRGVSVVASTYTYAWGELAPMIDPEKPLESGARVYLHPILNRSTGDKLLSMKRMVKDFKLDGVILHSDRSCKPYSLGQMDQRDRLVKELATPALLLEADHNDPRAFSDEQAMARLDAFMETMEVA